MSELIKALVEFHKEVPSITKDAKAQYGKYADLGGVLSTVTPPLSNAGLVIMQTFEPAEQAGVDPVLITRLAHTSGEEHVSRLPMIIGKGRNPLHDWGGSCTYQRRYAILSILGLCADMDTDGNFEQPEEKKTTRPARENKPAQAEATPQAEPSSQVEEAETPLTDEEQSLLRGVIKELPAKDRTKLLEKFRKEFGLAADAKVAYAINSLKHQDFIKNTMNEINS